MKLHTLLNTTPLRTGNKWNIDGVEYTNKEAAEMSKMNDEDKMQMHLVKSVFKGEMEWVLKNT